MTADLSSKRTASIDSRRRTAVESFQSAALSIGPIEPGMILFALTRGQFSMLDAILHVLEQVGPSRLSVWTWTLAEFEIEVLIRLHREGRLLSGLLVIDAGSREKYAGLLAR